MKLVLRRNLDDDWIAVGVGGWRLLSRAADVFPSFDAGRGDLLRLVRRSNAVAGRLSGGRAIVLAESSSGGQCRLWQMVAVFPSLRETLVEALVGLAPREAADRALELAEFYLGAESTFSALPEALPTGLDTVGSDGGSPIFVDFLPRVPFAERGPLEPVDAIHAAFGSQIAETKANFELQSTVIVDRLTEIAASGRSTSTVADALATVFLATL